MIHSMFQSMFHMQLPVLEKILRPMIVYLFLVGFLRLFGKRELAQLNPFDLVVLLSLSNTVQNAMIGDDNSVSGGIIGALALLAVNWALTRLLFSAPKLTKALEGDAAVLIRHGKMDHAAMKRESLTEEELYSVLHKQGFSDCSEVEKCVLEPNGNFYVEGRSPGRSSQQHDELMEAVKALSHEVKQLRAEVGK